MARVRGASGRHRDLPDQGDVLAARTLVELHRHIADIYPDTHLYLLSEGHLYADVEALGDDHAVSAYVDAARAMFANCDGVSVIDATELLPSGTWEQQRQALLERYCPSVGEIQEKVSVEPHYLELYNGYKKLYLALLSSPGPGPRYGQDAETAPSRMALRRRAKELALMQLRKYVGFARLVDAICGSEPYVKLSALYKSPEIADQVGINLISGNHQRATPSFHSVCLEANGSYRFIKAYEARQAGYALVANGGLPMFVAPSSRVEQGRARGRFTTRGGLMAWKNVVFDFDGVIAVNSQQVAFEVFTEELRGTRRRGHR